LLFLCFVVFFFGGVGVGGVGFVYCASVVQSYNCNNVALQVGDGHKRMDRLVHVHTRFEVIEHLVNANSLAPAPRSLRHTHTPPHAPSTYIYIYRLPPTTQHPPPSGESHHPPSTYTGSHPRTSGHAGLDGHRQAERVNPPPRTTLR